MARMSVDDSVARDPRITALAQVLGWSRRETVGALVCDVWPICYDQETHLVSERLIDAAAGVAGFAQAMLECELAARDKSGKIAISGARERIQYLDHKRRAGREGGLKSAERRTKEVKQTSSSGGTPLKQRGSRPQALGNPPVPDPSPVPVPDSAPDPVPVPEECASPPARAVSHQDGIELEHPGPRKPRQPSGPHQQAIAEFTAYYQRTHAGASPTWNGKTTKLMAELVKAHGLHEITRRLAVLERTPPAFPPAPWDLATFAQHFDRCAQAAAAQQPRAPQRDGLAHVLAIANGEIP